MKPLDANVTQSRYSVVEPASHTLHQCHTVEEFRSQFEAQTHCPIHDVTQDLMADDTPRAIFVAGSLPLGMGSSGSDIDLIVLVDSRESLTGRDVRIANSDQRMEFVGESALAGEFLTLREGILVDLQVAITPEVHNVYRRLRRRGPELSDLEVRTLGRLSSAWLLWQSDAYLERNAVVLQDPTLFVYCCTKSFVSALILRRKARKALDVPDLPLALQLGRSSVESAYLAYFASEGLPYLGARWMAMIGTARDANERVTRHPLLRQGIPLLFPAYDTTPPEAARYLGNTAEFIESMQALIEQKLLFRIAFKACPQIESA